MTEGSAHVRSPRALSAKARRQWAVPLATLLLAATIILGILAAGFALGSPVDPMRASGVVFVFSMLAYAALGWLIVVRGPRNALGWLFLTFPLLLAIAALLEEFGLRAAIAGSNVSAAWLLTGNVWLAFSGYFLLNGPTLVLFPNGQFPDQQLRRAFWATAAVVLICLVAFTVSAEPVCVARLDNLDCIRNVPNPFALVRINGLRQGAYTALTYTLLLGAGLALISVVARYRRAARQVRQQIKWVAWVSAIGVPLIIAFYGGQELFRLPTLGEWNDLPWIAVVSIAVPAAIGIAIFRYRLYEIDRLISRTTTYSLVALMLAAVYAGGVTLTQQILPVQNQFGIVLSTLAVAALFNPLRQRIQRAVDRRFNRSRYDAQRVLEAFSNQLRDEVDLDHLESALLRAAQETMQPAHVSIWMRERDSLSLLSGVDWAARAKPG